MLYDKVGFKPLFSFLMVICVLLSFFSYMFRTNQSAWFVLVQLDFFVVAGTFALFPTPVYKTFGKEKAP